ncbi:hypothetical protein WA026_002604 [Henosepilachna vigintioctopunctata]|uniref:Translational activator of cytochrome c oxidase 1 n=1 Tax=Henosepilachna vigintioctopunctata TaxID=420089 RepID=A0AAW1TTY3_9CUCU
MLCSIRNFVKVFNIYHELNATSRRYAGHSKWANIRHVKGLKDAERAALFAKLSTQIKIAVQEGGSIDPNANIKLEHVIEQAKRVNMPAATIQSVLKSTQTDKSQCKSYILEIKGPGNCFLLCEVFTSSIHHLKQSIATILRKNSSKFCDGIANNIFEEKGIIEAEIQLDSLKNKEQILEKATDDAIEAGAEEVTDIGDNVLQFICGSTNLKLVTQCLEKSGYNIISATIEYIPLKSQSMSENQMDAYNNLYEKLSKLPGVIRICDNIETE